MRKLTKDSNIYEIRDKIVKVYLKKILRRFRQLNQSLLAFDEINALSAVNNAYDDVINMTVDALRDIAKKTYRWVNGSDGDFIVDMWLSNWLRQADPVMHYKFYEEADRKRSRLFEAIESVRTSAERKKQIDTGLRYWSKQFEQTADNLVSAVVLQAYKDNGVKYVMWMIMSDAKVCDDCYRRKGKIYPVDSPLLKALHWNCRCWWIPVKYKQKL
jgi:SPP1 gp7 family putative phage head morphogenesis protein